MIVLEGVLQMKTFRGALVVAALLLAGAVSADPIDPQIIIRSAGTTGTVWITSLPFTLIPQNHPGAHNCYQVFNVGPDSLDGWRCEVGNRTGMDITHLTISFSAQGPLGCVPGPTNVFSSCTTDPNNPTFFIFGGGGVIPNNMEFYIDFLGFTDTTFRIRVPEPATFGLGLLGLAALLPLRRFISRTR